MKKEYVMHICADTAEEMMISLAEAAKHLVEEMVLDEPEDCDLPWEKQQTKVIEHCEWTAEEIRNFCLEEGYYTEGKVREYEEMLLFVDQNEPTPMNIYRVAKNILDHSDSEHERRIEYLMRDISVNIVNRFYEVRE